ATGGLLVLLAAMTLSVYKPWGMTAYGRRRAARTYSPSHPGGEAAPRREPIFKADKPGWRHFVGIHVAHAVVIVLLSVAVLHITIMHHH
ncbi:MAG TPA: hypothetical protein VGY98_12605, partial [Verrucomicrobiae bacterium]|nr:hypothetical protein [Verrucomicrobiae bacterium]